MPGLIAVLVLASTGFLIGVLTGLVPGLHVNNAALLLASAPLLALLPVSPEGAAVLIVAASVSHTFFDIVPSVLVGAPEPSTSLAVLPGHRLLMEGRAGEAIRLSAVGSGGAVVVALLLVLPVKLVFECLYSVVAPHLGWVLLFIVVVMLLSERGEPDVFGVRDRWDGVVARGRAVLVFLLAGVLGFVALRGDALGAMSSPVGVEVSVLFPLLTGLFGTSTIVMSLWGSARPPAQGETPVGVSRGEAARSVVSGSVAGSVVGWLPGVTAAQAAVLAAVASGGRVSESEGSGARSYLLSVSAVNSANAVFTLVALFTIGRARSGVMAAFQDLVDVVQWSSGLPRVLMAALLAVAFSGLLSFVVLTRASGVLASRFSDVSYDRVSVAVVVALVVGSLVTTGFFGLQVLVVGTVLGMVPPLLGVRRTHLMGCLLLPVMLYFFGLR